MEEEYHRRFWEKKLDVYMRLCHAASSLALAQPKSDEYKQANHELMLIYGGEFQVVASPEVKKAFGAFLSTVFFTPYSKVIRPPPVALSEVYGPEKSLAPSKTLSNLERSAAITLPTFSNNASA